MKLWECSDSSKSIALKVALEKIIAVFSSLMTLEDGPLHYCPVILLWVDYIPIQPFF